MDDVFVARVMSNELHTVDDDATVSTAAGRMLEAGVGSVLVVDAADRLRGLLTATDFVRLVRENDPEDETPVGDAMTTDVVTVGPQDTLSDVADLLTTAGYSHYPVTTTDDEVIGMLSTTDLTAHLAGL
ncbi:CBS domain-containing protein [Halorubrum vacuolatum]|uniref:CBS domain-containing protein n=1 Tax=Halorubrum vacuolatum TaxID=63740 RepID=A0A238UN95_HALVU|nr:CBS domain-containing protein [Halorubrum vacuolatum]SNR23077.1 CBS domain-containing protein [Halorubrum vacuolatum]